MSLLTLSDFLEYLYYGSTDIINMFSSYSAGMMLYPRVLLFTVHDEITC